MMLSSAVLQDNQICSFFCTHLTIVNKRKMCEIDLIADLWSVLGFVKFSPSFVWADNLKLWEDIESVKSLKLNSDWPDYWSHDRTLASDWSTLICIGLADGPEDLRNKISSHILISLRSLYKMAQYWHLVSRPPLSDTYKHPILRRILRQCTGCLSKTTGDNDTGWVYFYLFYLDNNNQQPTEAVLIINKPPSWSWIKIIFA